MGVARTEVGAAAKVGAELRAAAGVGEAVAAVKVSSQRPVGWARAENVGGMGGTVDTAEESCCRYCGDWEQQSQ